MSFLFASQVKIIVVKVKLSFCKVALSECYGRCPLCLWGTDEKGTTTDDSGPTAMTKRDAAGKDEDEDERNDVVEDNLDRVRIQRGIFLRPGALNGHIPVRTVPNVQ